MKAKPNVTESSGIMRIVTVSSQIAISVLAQSNMTENNENSFWYFIDISQGSVAKCLRCGGMFSNHCLLTAAEFAASDTW